MIHICSRGPGWPGGNRAVAAPKTTKGIKTRVVSPRVAFIFLPYQELPCFPYSTTLFHETPNPTNDEIHDHFGCSSLRFHNNPRRTGGARRQGCLGPKDPLSDRGDRMARRGNLQCHMGSRPETRERHEFYRDCLPVHERAFGHQCVNMPL